MDKTKTQGTIDQHWDEWFVKGLCDFVAVPNLTTMVDDQYLTNGLVEKAIQCVDDYINKLGINGLTREIFRAENGLPIVVYVVDTSPGNTKNVLIYGHLDKQRYGDGWVTDPVVPTIVGDLLYGRGGADDGYAPFSAMLAIKAAQE